MIQNKKMNPEVKSKWISALLSGEYKQGSGILRNKIDYFCCLGVLCDLYAKEHPEVEWKYTEGYSFLKCNAVLPYEVMEWAGIQDECGKYAQGKTYAISLAGANDSGSSFEEIAEIIKKNF